MSRVSAAAVGGILLAGGASRRLGFDKTGALLGDTPLAPRAARLLAAVCDEVVEVGVGASGLRCVREQPPGSGPLAALVAGVDALGCDRVVLLGVDQVGATAELLGFLRDAPGDAAVIPVRAGRAQYVCARYGPAAIAQARSRLAAGERSLRWVHDLDADAVWFPAEADWGAFVAAEVFDDVDTPADAQRLGVRAGAAPSAP